MENRIIGNYQNEEDEKRIVSCIDGICTHLRPKQGVADIAGAGFKSAVMDFAKFTRIADLESIGKPNRKINNTLPDIASDPGKLSILVDPFIEACQKEQVGLPVAYAPYLPRDTVHTDLNERLEELAVESIKLCSKSKSEYIVIRQLFAGIPYGKEWEVNKAFYLRLAPIAKENNVRILLENQCKDVGGHLVRGICTDGVRAAKWIDDLNEAAGEERFGFCMDIGASNVCGLNMYDFALDLGERIKAVIIRENDGDQERSILPFTQTPQTDYLSLFRGLRKIGYNGYLLMFFGATAGSSSPIIRPEVIHFAKTVGDYFKWQIDIENLIRRYPKRVLFGAGNMCRNYMKCYGEDFPPLFTCDNNQKLWGSEFCGLEVKPPEALKGLPEDCVIFICNVYYREIQQQLRDMGVKNPIEFFNDEYMPSFYFNRLEDVKS